VRALAATFALTSCDSSPRCIPPATRIVLRLASRLTKLRLNVHLYEIRFRSGARALPSGFARFRIPAISRRTRWISPRDRFYTLLYTRETHLTHGIQEVIQRITDEFRGEEHTSQSAACKSYRALRARFSRIVSDPRRAVASRVIREN